jgi:hypothetical protein
MKHPPLLLAVLVACSSGRRAPEPSPQPVSVSLTAPLTPAPPAGDAAVALAREILTGDGVACARDGRLCVTTMLERDGEGGDRLSYQVLRPGAVERTQVVYDFIIASPYEPPAAPAAAVDAALPALATLLRDADLVAVPSVAADDLRDTSTVSIAYGTLALGASNGSVVDLVGTDGVRRSVLPIDPLGAYSFRAAAQPPGTSMALLRVGYTLRGDDSAPTAEVAHLVNLGRESMLLGVLMDGTVACSAVPARCITRRVRRGDGGGTELAYQILTPGKTVDDHVICDGDLAECDEVHEEAAAISRAVAALLAAAVPGDVAELTATHAVDDAVKLRAGSLAIKGGALRLGSRTLDHVPARTRLLSAVAPPASDWLVATLEIPPDEGRAGNLVVARMYAIR